MRQRGLITPGLLAPSGGLVPGDNLLFPNPLGNSPSFSPLSVPGLTVWLKADVGTYQSVGGLPATVNNDPVGSWLDQSGSGNSVAQLINDSNRPQFELAIQNGLPGLLFDGFNDLLNVTFSGDLSQPTTMFVVVKQSTDRQQVFLDGIVSNKRQAVYRQQPASKWSIFAGSAEIGGGTSGTVTVLLSALFNGTSSLIRVNGVQAAAGNPGVQVISGLTVGAAFDGSIDLSGYIFEVLVYSGDKTASFASIEAYLNARWVIY